MIRINNNNQLESDKNFTLEKLKNLQKYNNLDDYLKINFTHYFKHDESQLYIVTANHTPNFTYSDIEPIDIHNNIIKLIGLLIFKKSKNFRGDTKISNHDENYNFYNILNNFIFAYGNYNYLEKISTELLYIYKKKLIPIYDTDYLYYNFDNIPILKTEIFNNNILWNSDWRFHKQILNEKHYNKIIEIIMFFIFDILVILYPTEWNFLIDGYIYKSIYKDINNNNYSINNYTDKNIILKTYLYQIWIINMFILKIDKDKDKKYIEKLPNILNNTSYNTTSFNDMTKLLIQYSNINNNNKSIIYFDRIPEDFINNTESYNFFKFNFIKNNNSITNNNIYNIMLYFIGIIIIIIIIIGLIIKLYNYISIYNRFK